MRSWGLAARIGAGLALALLAPAAGGTPQAEAKPGYEVQERALQLTVRPEASNGYEVTIETEGHRRVTLTARRDSSTVTYRTVGRVSRHGIEAEFGELGRVSVRFDGERRPFPGLLPPELKAQLPPDLALLLRRKCFGRKPVREAGTFRGSIRFEGENGFVEVEAKRAEGDVRRYYTRVCERAPGSDGERAPKSPPGLFGFDASIVHAVDSSPKRTVRFEAVGLSLGSPAEKIGSLFFVGGVVLERRDGMTIRRGALDLVFEDSVVLSPPKRRPVTATVTLPGPFSGSASYRKEAGVPAVWEGSLAFRPPGGGLVPLTGPSFSAAVCRFSLSEILTNDCLRRAGVPLPQPARTAPPVATPPSALERALAQGSGSQSQFR